MMRILFPLRIDREGNPISTIHKEIGTRLSREFEFISFGQDKKTACANVTLLGTSKNRFLDCLIINIKGILNLRSIDLIHFVPNVGLYPLFLISKLFGKKILYTIHESPLETRRRNILERTVLRQFAAGADRRVAISRFVSDSVKKEWELNCEIIFNGVDAQMFSPQKSDKPFVCKELGIKDMNRKMVLFVGALIARKGSDAVAGMAKDFPDCSFIIIGDGPMKKEILKCAARVHNIIYRKFLPPKFLSKVYASADLFLFPSSLESFGLVYVEALASGTPVLALNSGAAPEIIGEREGVLVGKRSELKQKLEMILSGKITFDKEALVRTASRNFNWDLTAKRYKGVYDSLLTVSIIPILG